MCDCVAKCVRGCVRWLLVLAHAAQGSSRIRPQVRGGLLCHSGALGCCFKTLVSQCAATTQNAFTCHQMCVSKTHTFIFSRVSGSSGPNGPILSPSWGKKAHWLQKMDTTADCKITFEVFFIYIQEQVWNRSSEGGACFFQIILSLLNNYNLNGYDE